MTTWTGRICLVVANGVLQNSSDVFYLLDPDVGASQYTISAIIKEGGDGVVELSLSNASESYTDGTLSPGTHRLGFLIKSGSAPRIWLNGSEVSHGMTSTTANASIFMAQVTQTDAIDPSNYGKEVSVRLITDPHFFTTSFPAGSYDIAGNTI